MSLFSLALIGVVVTYSSSAVDAYVSFGDSTHYLKKQVLAYSFGVVLIWVISKIPIRWLEKATLPLLLLSFLMLSLIFIPGAFVKVGGASRWLNLGSLRFQPSEFAKIAIIFFLAKNLSRKNNAKNMLPNIIIPLAACLLIMQQPDFGTSVVIMSISFILVFISGCHKKFMYLGVGSLSLVAIFTVVVSPYRVKRVLSFLEPWKNFQDGGFQLVQSFIGFSNGGAVGAGIGESKQKLFFLPEAHTDFVFSIIGEELGFLGVITVCLIYSALIASCYAVSNAQKTLFLKLLGLGITSLIALQTLLNMFISLGLLPTKGLPLPFLSCGMSSLTVFLCSIGIIYRLGLELIRHNGHTNT